MMMASDAAAGIAAAYLALQVGVEGPLVHHFNQRFAFSGSVSHLAQLAFLASFITMLVVIGRRDGLYRPVQRHSAATELRLTVRACFSAGLLLCGSMYMTQLAALPPAVVVCLVVFSTILLCMLRASWRYSINRRHERGIETRNVVVLGTCQVSDVVRRQIARNRRLGRIFKGFVVSQDCGDALASASENVVGSLNELRQIALQHFIDEIIIAEPCSTSTVVDIVDMARDLNLEVLVVRGFHDELTTGAPVEYLGDFPVVALHRRHGRVLARTVKRVCDVIVSLVALIVIAPTLLLAAIAIKLDSGGPVLYISERVGRRGRAFRCLKFRTMVPDAERIKASLAEQNERSGILFKIKNDPRVTRVGQFMRKYSLDELPQLLNVLRGDMSLVGPRPPLASEVQQYQLQHLRRLEVLPGITGLWQVRARQEPSFERYVALDLAYVENWSLWMDLKIMFSTAEVVLRGTGS